jgi:hypothetical protein
MSGDRSSFGQIPLQSAYGLFVEAFIGEIEKELLSVDRQVPPACLGSNPL